MKSFHRLTLLLFVLVFAVRVAAQEPRKAEDTLSIDMPNEGRLAILRQVADLFELNIVKAAGFPDEKISVKLRDVTWRQIFETCLIGTGYIYVARGNVVWLVPAGSPLQEFGLMRDKLDQEIDETLRLREVIAFLTRPNARALTKTQRAQIRAFLDDPDSSAADLLQKLGPDTTKSKVPPAK